MQTATQSEELVVWTQPKTLAEAKTLFAPYSPKFQTVPSNIKMALGKMQVSVLYLSSPVQDAAVESTLATLRNGRRGTLSTFSTNACRSLFFGGRSRIAVRNGQSPSRGRLLRVHASNAFPRDLCKNRASHVVGSDEGAVVIGSLSRQ
jgi:hypothetical protein